MANLTDETRSTLQRVADLIKAGQREQALASLAHLHRENPRSAYIPFLMGNLYADKLWWSVAIDKYGDAIKNNAA